MFKKLSQSRSFFLHPMLLRIVGAIGFTFLGGFLVHSWHKKNWEIATIYGFGEIITSSHKCILNFSRTVYGDTVQSVYEKSIEEAEKTKKFLIDQGCHDNEIRIRGSRIYDAEKKESVFDNLGRGNYHDIPEKVPEKSDPQKRYSAHVYFILKTIRSEGVGVFQNIGKNMTNYTIWDLR